MIDTRLRCQEHSANGTTKHGCPNEVHIRGPWSGLGAMRLAAAEFGWVVRLYKRQDGTSAVHDYCPFHAAEAHGTIDDESRWAIEAARIRRDALNALRNQNFVIVKRRAGEVES